MGGFSLHFYKYTFNFALNSAFFYALVLTSNSTPIFVLNSHVYIIITFSLNTLFIRGKPFYTPTLHNLFCSRFFRLGRSMCRSHPGTGCTPRTSGRLRATPGPGRLSVCTGHGSGFHILHTWRILASLQRSHTEVTHTHIRNPRHSFIEVCNIHVSIAPSRTASVLQSTDGCWCYVRDRCYSNIF